MTQPNSWLVYPDVPEDEKDPYARINTIIAGFNAETNKNVKRGLFQEIYTAIYLVTHGKITHGKQISRSLTDAEKGHYRGDSQMILVPIESGNSRELDMVYEADGILYIVEAKNTKSSDFHQLRPNVQLAQRLGAGIVYALAQKSGQEKHLRTQYNAITQMLELPPLQVIQIPQKISDVEDSDPDGHLAPLPTLNELVNFAHRRNYLGESIDIWDEPSRMWAPFPDAGHPVGLQGTNLNLPIEPTLPRLD